VVYKEESGMPERYTHWYVVWKQFEGVDEEDRSRIILDAIEEVFGREAVLRVTTAMGLIPGDPVAKDIATHYELSTQSRRCACVAEERAAYGKPKRGRKTKVRRKS